MNISILFLFLINIITIFGYSLEDSNSEDCQNLMSFFNNYMLTSGHKLNIPTCCDDSRKYHFITCENGSITAIELRFEFNNEQIDFSNFPVLPNLRKLLFEGPIFKDGLLPSKFFDLPKLEDLEILSSNISLLPVELNKKCPIRKLNLYNNTLNGFPSQILDYDLTFLDLSRNGNIGSIPSKIKNLKNLETLYIGMTGLTSMSEEIFNLQNLNEFDLDGNPGLSTKIYNFGSQLETCDFRNTTIICYEPGTCRQFIIQEEPFRKFGYDSDNMFETCTDSFKSRESGSFFSRHICLSIILCILIILLLLLCIFFCCFKREEEKGESEIEMREDIYASPTIEMPNSFLINSSQFPITEINSFSSSFSGEKIETASLSPSQFKNVDSPSLSPSEFNISSIPNNTKENKFNISSFVNTFDENENGYYNDISSVPLTNNNNNYSSNYTSNYTGNYTSNYNISSIPPSSSVRYNNINLNSSLIPNTSTVDNNFNSNMNSDSNFVTSFIPSNSVVESSNNSHHKNKINSSLIPNTSIVDNNNNNNNIYSSNISSIRNTDSINNYNNSLSISAIPNTSTIDNNSINISTIPNSNSVYDKNLNISSLPNIVNDSFSNSFSYLDTSIPQHATKNLEVPDSSPNHRILVSPQLGSINTNNATKTQYNIKPQLHLKINTVSSSSNVNSGSDNNSNKLANSLSPNDRISSNINLVTPNTGSASAQSAQSVMQNLADLVFMDDYGMSPQLTPVSTYYGNEND